ncbi:MarR family winged helix-turn-helix transcriptional regulator [Saccharopolyspora rosea]|uniref:MarR family winged helix-turn-helix transcriptional regulator n=1 Tax=Saccharopolyspora rosea TaxID=524884 RepID=A0ABW3G173_9PSEU|nr:helix-turn-helix domain-containing protein [Saccharopolyspora rosea]
MTEEPRARIWRRMRSLVLDEHDRRKQVCRELGMSFIRVKALRRVARQTMTMGELTEALMTDRPYTTVVVGDLERRGLVERTSEPHDRRCKKVTATAAGLAAAREAERILNEPPAPLRELGADDLAELDRILTALSADPD